jgi:hypothetical protein
MADFEKSMPFIPALEKSSPLSWEPGERLLPVSVEDLWLKALNALNARSLPSPLMAFLKSPLCAKAALLRLSS